MDRAHERRCVSCATSAPAKIFRPPRTALTYPALLTIEPPPVGRVGTMPMIYVKNLPAWERMLRILAGAVAIAYGWLAAPSTLVLGIAVAVGVMLIVTSLVGFCPACAMIGRRPLRH